MEPNRELRKFIVALAEGSAAERALKEAIDGRLNGLSAITCSNVEATEVGLLRLRRIPMRQSPAETPQFQVWWVRPGDVAAVFEFAGEPTRAAGFLATH